MIEILIAVGIPALVVLMGWGISAGIRRNAKNEIKVNDFIWDIIGKVNFDWDRAAVSDTKVDVCNEAEEVEEVEELDEADKLIKEAREWKV
jgi:hypothetical protein